MRAADGGWAARFSAFFATLGFLRFDRESEPTPTAANACRWPAISKTENQ
jgi:N-acetylglutamate synthase-like GNAT family acetyltransferase